MSSTRRAADDPAALLTIPQAAAVLALAPRTIWQLIRAGELTPIRFGKHATRLDRSELERFVEISRARTRGR